MDKQTRGNDGSLVNQPALWNGITVTPPPVYVTNVHFIPLVASLNVFVHVQLSRCNVVCICFQLLPPRWSCFVAPPSPAIISSARSTRCLILVSDIEISSEYHEKFIKPSWNICHEIFLTFIINSCKCICIYVILLTLHSNPLVRSLSSSHAFKRSNVA